MSTLKRAGNVLTEQDKTDIRRDIGLGTAAQLDVPSSGNATSGQVVKGSDTRLSDARTPTSHTHTASAISDFSSAADARIAAASINALADVAVTSPSAGQVLKWDGSAWVNDTDAGGAGATNLTYTASPTGGTVNSDTGTDASVPLSDGTNAGLMAPAQHTKLAGIAASATANAMDAQLRDRSTHTGTQSAATITGLAAVATTGAYADLAGKPTLGTAAATDASAYATAAQGTDSREWSAATVTQAEAEAGTDTARKAWTVLRVWQAIAAWWAASAMKTKLDGIASGATANATDAQLRDRSTHTGTQAFSTLTMSTARLLGRSTAGSGGAEEIAVGSGLSLSGGTLSASGGGGTPGGSSGQLQYNNAGAFGGASAITTNGTSIIFGSAAWSIPRLYESGYSNIGWATSAGNWYFVTSAATGAGIFGLHAVDNAAHVYTKLGFGTAVPSANVYLQSGGSNILDQRNGASAQEYRVYGTYTDASNYRRLSKGMSAAGVAHLRPEGAGSGASGNVLHISGLPTSNPGPGILWNDGGTVKVGT